MGEYKKFKKFLIEGILFQSKCTPHPPSLIKSHLSPIRPPHLFDLKGGLHGLNEIYKIFNLKT